MMNSRNHNQRFRMHRLVLAITALITLIIAPVCAPLCAARTCDGSSSKLTKKAAGESCHHSDSFTASGSNSEIHGMATCTSVELTAIPVSFARFEENQQHQVNFLAVTPIANHSFTFSAPVTSSRNTQELTGSRQRLLISPLILRI